jgi:hypothetical protein
VTRSTTELYGRNIPIWTGNFKIMYRRRTPLRRCRAKSRKLRKVFRLSNEVLFSHKLYIPQFSNLQNSVSLFTFSNPHNHIPSLPASYHHLGRGFGRYMKDRDYTDTLIYARTLPLFGALVKEMYSHRQHWY